MLFSKILMIVMACFFTLGAFDRLFGNRLKLGAEFIRGFDLMGPTALSIVGLFSLAPVLAAGLKVVLEPLFSLIGVDVAMFPSIILSSEMSYPLAAAMTENSQIALFSGIIVGSVMGGTISFAIPLACGMISKEDNRYFAAGTLSGYILDPIACFLGGIFMGMEAKVILIALIPVLFITVIMVLGMLFLPELCMKIFRIFSKFLMAVITVGLAAAAIKAMTGFELIPGMTDISEGFKTIGTICLSVTSALCLLSLVRRLLSKPLARAAAKLGLNEISMLSMILGLTTIVPGYSSYHEMNGRGRVIYAALTASMCPMLGVHLGIAASVSTAMILPMLAARLVAGFLAVLTSLFFMKRLFTKEELDNA